jgi:shikimate kinase
MKKIQVTTIEKMASVQVIELNASFIAKVVRLQAKLEPILVDAKRVKTRYNEVTQKREEILDEKGNKVYEYKTIPSELVVDEVMPFLEELCAAFEE